MKKALASEVWVMFIGDRLHAFRNQATSLSSLAIEVWGCIFQGQTPVFRNQTTSMLARPFKIQPQTSMLASCDLLENKNIKYMAARSLQNITQTSLLASTSKEWWKASNDINRRHSERNIKHFAWPSLREPRAKRSGTRQSSVVKQLCRALLLCTQFFIFQPLSAATITIPGINDQDLSNKLVTLAESNASIPVQEAQMKNVTKGLLSNLTPQIKALAGYDNPFMLNCTIFFNSQIEKVNCDLDFDPPEGLLKHADPQSEILRANLEEIYNSNILVIRAYVDWSAGSYIYGRGKIYLKQPPLEEEIEDISKTFSRGGENTETMSVTSDVTGSYLESNTLSATPDTLSETVPETMSVLETPTKSLDVSQTLTDIPIPVANWSAASGLYEDATNQPGRYKVENGIVTDAFSNLQWERYASNNTMSWLDANYYCSNRTTGGHRDWRLPAVLELQSLLDYTIDWKGDIPGINVTVFPNTPLNYFWSSTPVAENINKGWYVSFGKGDCFIGLICARLSGWCNCALGDMGYARCVYGTIIPPVTNDRYDNSSIPTVVTDLITGLMWERMASNIKILWPNTIAHCASNTAGSLSGWRVPTPKELATLLNYNITTGSLIMNQDVFLGESVDWYWSSSVVSDAPSGVWNVYFGSGSVGDRDISNYGKIRCVCDSNCTPIPIANWNASTGIYEDATNQTGRYKVEDGVVTDTFSNLQWEQASSLNNMTWAAANSYCTNQTTGSLNNWRLPTVLELHSLVDYKIDYRGPVINMTFFPGTLPDTFWSSTPTAGSTTEAWCVTFGTQGGDEWGGDNAHYTSISTPYYVRCIRGSNNTITDRYDDTSLPGVVKDKLTGLWWEKSTGNTKSSWNDLQSYCSGRNTGSITKWRPPTIKELLTVVDYKVPPGSFIMDAVFSGTESWYWSSSAVSGSGSAWNANFLNAGEVGHGNIGNVGYVRCVVLGT